MLSESQVVTSAGCVALLEACRQSFTFRLVRENDVVRFESIPIVRDFGRRGGGLLDASMAPWSLWAFSCTF